MDACPMSMSENVLKKTKILHLLMCRRGFGPHLRIFVYLLYVRRDLHSWSDGLQEPSAHAVMSDWDSTLLSRRICTIQ